MADRAQALEAVLAAERDALTTGALDRLADIHSEKEAVIAELAADPARLDGSSASRLREMAAHNETLLQAASQGLRRTMSRLAERREVAYGLTTYSSDGSRTTARTPRHRLERRA